MIISMILSIPYTVMDDSLDTQYGCLVAVLPSGVRDVFTSYPSMHMYLAKFAQKIDALNFTYRTYVAVFAFSPLLLISLLDNQQYPNDALMKYPL